jgi:hypothetical protein
MAKTQDLPLNAPEVSGVCGRLLCCLAYENDFYTEARKQMPRVNSLIETPEGVGKVRQVHVLANTITVMVEGPNETRSWVQMPVPEPEFRLSAGQFVAGKDAGETLDAAAEVADELDAQDGMDAPGEDVIPGRDRRQQQMPDEASDTGPRSGARKRRKR